MQLVFALIVFSLLLIGGGVASANDDKVEAILCPNSKVKEVVKEVVEDVRQGDLVTAEKVQKALEKEMKGKWQTVVSQCQLSYVNRYTDVCSVMVGDFHVLVWSV